MSRSSFHALVVSVLLLLVTLCAIHEQAGAQGPCGSCPPGSSCQFVCGEGQCRWQCAGGGAEPPTPPTAGPTAPSTQEPLPSQTPPPQGTPSPTSTPQPPEPGLHCWDCVPWVHCPSGYARNLCVVFTPDGGQWLHSWSCMSAQECQSPPVSNNPGPPDPPCTPAYGGSGVDLNCSSDGGRGFDWGYLIQVWARVPPHRVRVWPFPRWLVAMGAPLPPPYQSGPPGTLTLLDEPAFSPHPSHCGPEGPGGEGGCWSAGIGFPSRPLGSEPQEGDVRNYQIGLRWRRVVSSQPHPSDLGAVPPTCWDFNERPWNIGADYGYGRVSSAACGTQVSHIYETSSWGLPPNGPRFVEGNAGCDKVPQVWDMPAYQVRVYTTWAAEWAVQFDRYECVEEGWSPCFCRPEGEPVGLLHESCMADDSICQNCGGWCGRVYTCSRRDWVHHFEGWYPMDLRRFGGATWYHTSWAVIAVGEGPWCPGGEYSGGPGSAVPVPVIEVQSVLRDPCIADRSCPPGYP